ncbi:MAG: YlxR family protein [Deltaproteobacteria bacterium]|nr:YlxR family protein [Deltaproteobacteria bacterium]
MSKGKGHIPIRTCISCGRKGSKKSMIRLVLSESGSVVRDKSGSAPGRGAYVCNETRCIELLKEGRRLAKAFRRKC